MIPKLQLLLAIQKARDAGFNHFAAALVKLYMMEYPEGDGK